MMMPMMMAPAPMPVVPMPVVPTPMAVVPVPMMPAPVAVMPVHLFGLQATNLVARGDSRLRIAIDGRMCLAAEGKRCERRCLHGCCEGGRTGSDGKGHL